MEKLLFTFQPAEVLVEKAQQNYSNNILANVSCCFAPEDWAFTEDHAREKLLRHFDTTTLKGFGIDGMTEAVQAQQVLLYIIWVKQNTATSSISGPFRAGRRRACVSGRFTVRNLELLHPIHGRRQQSF